MSYDQSLDDEYYKVNGDLTIALASKAKEEGVKQFIFLSSMIVYGESKKHNQAITNQTPLQPSNAYAKSKLDAENKLKELESSEFKVCILRLPMIYGPNAKGNYAKLSSMALKIPIFLKTSNQRSMLSIDNLMKMIEFIILKEKKGLYFPQNKEFVNTSTLFKTIREIHGKKTLLIPWTGWLQHLLMFIHPMFRKLFGSQYYDRELSQDFNDLNLDSFKTTLLRSEGFDVKR